MSKSESVRPGFRSRLKMVLVGALFSTLPHCATLRPSDSSEIYYTIEPIAFEGKPSLKFTLSFQGSASGRTEIKLPDQWASEHEYFKDIKNLSLAHAGQSLTDGAKPNVKLVQHRPGDQVVLQYVLVARPAQGDNPYRALIENDFFHWIGVNGFVTPGWPSDHPYSMTIDWRGFSEKFTLANSFGANERQQHFSDTFDHLQSAIFVGGDFRITQDTIHGQKLYTAVRDSWKFSDAEFMSTTKKIVQAERDFWPDYSFPYFLVTLIPNGRKCCSNGGTALTNSFATFASEDFTLDQRMIHLLAHELFHTWNGHRMEPAEPEGLLYWFSEGFTDYFSRALSFRAGLLPRSELLKEVNEVIYNYEFSPVATEPNERIRQDFWKNHDVEKLPYLRGELIAWNWNAEIKRRTHGEKSLDDFIRSLYADIQHRPRQVTLDLIRQNLTLYLGGERVQHDIDEIVVAGHKINLAENILGPCIGFKSVTTGKFDHGFDYKKTYDTKVITGLKTDSPAYRAGLRNGQKLLDRKIVSPPFEPSRMKVADKHGERWIEFLPVGKDRRKVQILEERCATVFGSAPVSTALLSR